jgi:hypothetical protein
MTWEPFKLFAPILEWLGKRFCKSRDRAVAADRRLYKRFLTELPSNGCIQFLEVHDFGNSFHLNTLDPLHAFVKSWGQPEFHFHDRDIDSARENLRSASLVFLHEIAQKTSPKSGELQGIYKWYNDGRPQSGVDEKQLRKEMEETMKLLNDSATNVFNTHQTFILLAKKKLQM